MPEETYNPLKSPYHPLKHLAAVRRGYSDKITAEVIHSNDADNRYKVRGVWWAAVLHCLENAIRERMITDEVLTQSIGKFTAKVQAMQFGDDTPASLRTAADIA